MGLERTTSLTDSCGLARLRLSLLWSEFPQHYSFFIFFYFLIVVDFFFLSHFVSLSVNTYFHLQFLECLQTKQYCLIRTGCVYRKIWEQEERWQFVSCNKWHFSILCKTANYNKSGTHETDFSSSSEKCSNTPYMCKFLLFYLPRFRK